MLIALILPFLVWICYTDIRYRIIKNQAVFIVAAISAALAINDGQFPYLVSATIVFVIGTVVVCMNFIGAGDIKLLAALALVFPLSELPDFIFFVALSGLPLSIIVYILSLCNKERFSRVVPYGVAIVSGYLLTLLV